MNTSIILMLILPFIHLYNAQVSNSILNLPADTVNFPLTPPQPYPATFHASYNLQKRARASGIRGSSTFSNIKSKLSTAYTKYRNKPSSSRSPFSGQRSPFSRPLQSSPPPYHGFYAGGSSVPFRSGSITRSGLRPGALFLPLAIFPGIWLASTFPYHFHRPWVFTNHSSSINPSNDTTTSNSTLQSKPVVCLCQENRDCACDENHDPNFIQAMLGTGEYAALNKSMVNVADYNGKSTIFLNGTLPDAAPLQASTASTYKFHVYFFIIWVIVMMHR